jgi:hypothetical protein
MEGAGDQRLNARIKALLAEKWSIGAETIPARMQRRNDSRRNDRRFD